MAYSETEARRLVAESAKRLLNAGLVARTWGNISARIPDGQFIITPSGMGYEHMGPEDLVKVRIEDCSWEGERKPSSEKGIHADAYRLRPEVNFVIHTHQEAASIYGVTGRTLTGLESECLGAAVPCAEYGMPSTGKLRRAVARALEDYPDSRAVFMRFHGALCVGEDSETAFRAAGELERACERQIALLSEQKDREEPEAPVDYGKSLRKGNRFCILCGGEKKVYHLKRLPKTLAGAAAIHARIYQKTDACCVIWNRQEAVREVSRRETAFRPYLEDLIQIAGTDIRCADGTAPAGIVRRLKGRSAVLVKGQGAFCTGRTRDDAEAAAILLEKSCRAALFAEHFPDCSPVGRLDGLIQRMVYVRKYARKKEEQPGCTKS